MIMTSIGSFCHLLNKRDKLSDLFRLVDCVIRSESFLDAVFCVNIEDLNPCFPGSGLKRDELLEDVDAVAVLFHHFDNASGLAFNPPHASDRVCKLAHILFVHRRFSVVETHSRFRCHLQILRYILYPPMVYVKEKFDD